MASRILARSCSATLLELALGILTMAIRYPNHFVNWGVLTVLPTPVCGVSKDRSGAMPQQKPLNCLQLNSQGSVRLLRRGEDIENYIKNITHGLDVKFEAVVDGDREIQQQSTGEVSTAPPMPEETTGNENVQPEEEDEVEILNQGIRQAVTEQVSDMVGFLETGRITVGTRELTFCVACGSSRHALRDCHTNYRPLLTSLQHMWLAIQHYPTSHRITIDREEDGTLNVSQQPSEADVSMDVETGSAASSTTRRPEPKPDHFNQPSWQM